MIGSPIFILGNPRSGTTILRLSLAAHPRISIPPESAWLIRLTSRFGAGLHDSGAVDAFIAALRAAPKMEAWRLDFDLIRANILRLSDLSYASAVDAVYRTYLEQFHPSKDRWGDKNNPYVKHVRQLAGLFPTAQFVHIVRDGRDVASSYLSLTGSTGKYAPHLPRTVVGAALQWRRNVLRVDRALADLAPERAITIRYEDLVNHPEDTLRRACAALREDFDPAMLVPMSSGEHERESWMGWKQFDYSGINTAACARWERDLSRRQARLVDACAGDVLEQFGYRLSGRNDASIRAANVAAKTGLALVDLGTGAAQWYRSR